MPTRKIKKKKQLKSPFEKVTLSGEITIKRKEKVSFINVIQTLKWI